MFLRNRIPLARLNLVHSMRRLMDALGGIGFAVVLMFMETGFEHALFDSTVKVYADLDGEILLTNNAYKTLLTPERFDRDRLYQARACPGVKGAWPLYIQVFGNVWRAPGDTGRGIRVLACDLADPVFTIPEVAEHAAELRAPGTALYDVRSKRKYGVPLARREMVQLRDAELGNHAIRLVGAFSMGTDFACDGTLILSDRNFARHCAQRLPGGDPLAVVDVGVVQVEPGADVLEIQRRLAEILPGDMAVHTKQELIQMETDYWDKSTGIGFIFRLGAWLGFFVGVIICYQVISADIGDHMAEFATLKAMGYRRGYFIAFVLQEALWLSVLAFVPGLLVSAVLYALLARLTGLLMLLTVPRAAWVFLLTALMCIASGALSMRKVLAADPADLY